MQNLVVAEAVDDFVAVVAEGYSRAPRGGDLRLRCRRRRRSGMIREHDDFRCAHAADFDERGAVNAPPHR